VRARSGPGTDVAVLVDPAAWLDGGATRGRRSTSSAARTEMVTRQQRAADLLRAAGWQVVLVRPDQSVDQVWQLLRGAPTAATASPGVPA
jgi:hypothetical protein